MRNLVKEKLARGEPTIGHWLSIPSSTVAELLTCVGMDWLLMDTEHSPIGYETMEDLLRAIKDTNVVPLARVAAAEAPLIKKVLDRGVCGVLVPLVNTAAEARNVVAACKYPPEGIRGVAGTRVSRWGCTLAEYYREWNDNVLIAIQIETKQALENVEEIAAVPGVDVLFVGPADLSANLGTFQQFDHPRFKSAVQRILNAAKNAGIAAGYMSFGAESVLEKVDEGFRFIAAGTDTKLLLSAAQATYERINEGLRQRRKSGKFDKE